MSHDLVTVAKVANAQEAYLIKNRLEEEGITAYIANEMSADVLRLDWAGEIKVQVPEEHADRAEQLLAEMPEEARPEDMPEPAEPEEECAEEEERLAPEPPREEAQVPSTSQLLARRALVAAVSAAAVLPLEGCITLFVISPLLVITSFYFLYRLGSSEGELSSSASWMCYLAFGIDLLVAALLLLIFRGVFLFA